MREENQRLFVGLFPESSVVESIEEWVEPAKSALEGLRWMQPANLHLTLCFLGNVRTERIADLESGLERASTKVESFELVLAGAGCFPNVRKPRILWAGIKGDLNRLHCLQQAVSEVCAPFIEKLEDRPFSPHLTLARIKDMHRGDLPRLEAILESASTLEFSAWPATAIQLVSSHTGSTGSTYSVVRSFSLKGATATG